MPFQQQNSIRYYTFDSLAGQPVTQAAFTRQGGASRGEFASLNVGSTLGDELADVQANMEAVFAAVNRPRSSIFDSWLVHGDHALVADAPRPPEMQRPPQADIILTDKPEISLFMRYADCVPLLFYDPRQRAVALAHAGWKGTVLQVGAKAVAAMAEAYGSRPGDLIACIGPSISAEHYEIGPEVVDEVRTAYGADAEGLLPAINGSTHLDLWAANRLTLEQAGVGQIEVAAQCTFAQNEDWFSHRASGGHTGRFGVLLALDPR
jgi:YfiH family protein